VITVILAPMLLHRSVPDAPVLIILMELSMDLVSAHLWL
jgi:hypothetical protein